MRWPVFLFGLIWGGILQGQTGPHRDFLPPFNFHVDSVTLLATWQPPKIVLLDEDFEGDAFPPAGWTSSTLGAGWQGVSSPAYEAWVVPDHPGRFALANDDVAGGMNNGSQDLLFTPVLDLTVADSFMLAFDTYFDAGWGQEAYVKYSLDSGLTWPLLLDVPAKLEWQKIVVDLSEFSGEGGDSTFQLLFHADDNGWASGWAVDNVQVTSDEIGEQPEYYKIFLENTQIAQLSDTSYWYYIEFNTTRECGVVAKYEGGVSDTAWQTVYSNFPPPPKGIAASIPDEVAILYWGTPAIPSPHYKRESFDSVFCFPSLGVLPEGGCDSDGLHIFSVFENSDSVYKYDFFGNLIEKFTIPGIPGLYDLAYVPYEGCFYGGKGGHILYKMNFQEHTLISTIVTPVAIKGLAYDIILDGFWASDWLGNMTLFDFAGNIIRSIPALNIGNIYGLAYDAWTSGGPYLWALTYQSSNNLLVTISIAAGVLGAYSIDLTTVSLTGGIVGGLYSSENNPFGNVILGGNLKNDVFFGFELYDLVFNQSVPEGLLGFNIYKDDEFMTYTQGYIWGEPNTYHDTLLYPVQHIKFEITALYDATLYGSPGDTAESLPEGPAYAVVGYFLDLDFFENWEYSNQNLWTIPINEWYISEETGNEPPAAVFMPDSLLSEYQSSLKSWPFTIVGSPSPDIFLSYDLSLSSSQNTGNEILDVQVYDDLQDEWKTVMTYSNASGSFDWQRDTVKISDHITGGIFMIRFTARGESSSDIEYWAIDNIALNKSCVPPKNVEAQLGPVPEDSIRITWQEPWPTLAEWRQWDDGVQYSLMSFAMGKDNWTACASRWDPEHLTDLKDAYLTAVGLIPGEATTYYKVAVWTGEERELVYTQATENLVLNEWNIIPLNEPLAIDITKDLLIGYQSAQYSGLPHSLDNGPAIDGYGNLLRIGSEWSTLLEINPELDFNWNIKAFFERDSIPVGNYNLYRSIDGSDYQLIAQLEETEYLDEVSNWNAEYCYALKAVYPYEVCVSGYSEESCILAVSIDPHDISGNSFLHIYPNPSQGIIFLKSSEEIHRIRIYNASGKLIFNEEVNDNHKEIHLEDNEPGVYLVQVLTRGGSHYHKIVVF